MVDSLKNNKLLVIAVFTLLVVILAGHYIVAYRYYRSIIREQKAQVEMALPIDTQLESICYTDDSINRAYRELAFIQAQLQMSSSDSAGLVISIPDSTIAVQIKGVNVFTTKILEYRYDFMLNDLGIHAYRYFYGKPLVIQDHAANIAKEPIVHIVAPADTAAARQAPKHQPDTTLINTVHVRIVLDNNMTIALEGNHVQDLHGYFLSQWKLFSDRLQLLTRMTKSLFSSHPPEYKYSIQLKVDNRDAQIIYRALPSNSLACIRP